MSTSPATRLVSLALLAAVVACCLVISLAQRAAAMEQPRPGMIEQMKADGTYSAAAAFARQLGNYRPKPALRGAALPAALAPQEIADRIVDQLGQSLDAKGAKSISAASARELSWAELDLNHDRVVDERDVLALGFPLPKDAARFPSMGTSKTFCLLLDFPDYPHYFTQEEIQNNLFSEGTTDYYYQSLHHYYELASYGQLNTDGMAYGWHTASHPRTWYHPDDSKDYGYSWQRQGELVEEAIRAYDEAGEDFSQYDNDGDGSVDYFLVVWSGPVGDWATFWWGYFGVGLPGDFRVDGVNFPAYSWQWERYYGFGGWPPEMSHWDPLVTIHETGHALGLPDYYDYDGGVGPPGGVGGLDMMDGNWGDHNCFSKYLLGWLAPTVAFANLNDWPMREANVYGDCVIFMPGFDPASPWAEYFIAQNRNATGLDASYPASGELIWHIDARVNPYGGFMYDNSYAEHKLLKLMEADGQEDIENWRGANAGDFYVNGSELSPASNPNSNRYDGSVTGAACNDISIPDSTITADFVLYTSNPPNVSIDTPAPGSVVSGTVPVGITATDDGVIAKVQVIIDGQVAEELTSAPYNYSWNTLVEFNKTLTLTARAWDTEGQSSSATIEVTVDNTGVTVITDDFESGLAQWRALDVTMEGRGSGTHWATRESPGDPAPLGSGHEAWVRPDNPDESFGALDYLRSMRIDATAFVKPLHVHFYYRGRSGFALYRSIDNGASWVKLEDLADSYGWQLFNRTYALQGQVVYLRFAYTGDVREAGDYSDNGRGANIDDLWVRESPSDIPTVSFISPADGDSVSGLAMFAVDAQDDGSIARVDFYVMGGLVYSDYSPPWIYERDTTQDDNHPDVLVAARAEDNDGLPSAAAGLDVRFVNPHPYPVYDEMQDGSPNWSYQNDSYQPQWQFTDRDSVSRPYSMGWVVDSGLFQPDNYEGVWFLGGPVAVGRQAVDLAGGTVNDPVLRFMYKAHFPSGGSMSLYFYNTWLGWQWIADISDNQDDWVQKTISLAPWIGESAQLCFWIWPVSATDGQGVWLDDLWFGNRGPQLGALTPNPASAGGSVTLSGSGFGAERLDSVLTYDGVPLLDAAYQSWSNAEVRFTVPPGVNSGYVGMAVGGQPSNVLRLAIGLAAPQLLGVADGEVYRPQAPPALAVQADATTERVQFLIDGEPVDELIAAPFDGFALPFMALLNGEHTAQLRAFRGGDSAYSPLYRFTVYALVGDANCDGVVGLLDQAALMARLGMWASNPLFEPWFDPDGDGRVTEADLSYLGYHYGESLPF